MKRVAFLFLLFSIFFSSIYGQTYRIINTDASSFPLMKASFYANDNFYTSDSLKRENVTVTENNQIQDIHHFEAPKQSVLPTSIVLVLDVSGSMEGRRMDILRKTAKAFIAKLPMDVTEIAIASFNAEISIQCDFTQNINTLNKSIDRLYPIGGTNFNNAFLTPFSGALSIVDNAQYRKAIIFISDGQSEVKKNFVINKANADSVIISCLTIGLPISAELRYIAKQTGGNVYSGLRKEKEINTALDQIYLSIQQRSLGKIEWTSNYSCNPELSYTINIKNDIDTINYTIPTNKIGKISITPSTVYFSHTDINTTEYKPIYILGDNVGTNITAIKSTNHTLFGIDAIDFPIKSKANEVMQLKLTFTPKDSIYTTNRYTITNPGCPDITINAVSAGKKKLIFTSPLKGSVYNAGNKIPIAWKGIEQSTAVSIYYQAKGSAQWNRIKDGTDYRYDWNAPFTNDSICIKGEVTNNISLANLLTSNVNFYSSDAFKDARFSPNGKQLITRTETGVVKSWNASNAYLNFQVEGVHTDDVGYFPSFNRLISISDTIMIVLTNRNGMEMIAFPLNKKRLWSSFTFVDGKELYASIWNYNSLTPNTNQNKYEEATSALKGKFGITISGSKLSVINKASYKKHFSINVNSTFKRAILHQNQSILAVEYFDKTVLYNLESKKVIAQYENEGFEQFSEGGKFIITENSTDKVLNLLEDGERVFQFQKDHVYKISHNDEFIALQKQDSLLVYNIATNNTLLAKPKVTPQLSIFFPKSDQLLFVAQDSLFIYNMDDKKQVFSTAAESNIIKHIDISPDEKSLLISTNNIVALWNISEFSDSDTTDYIKINIPKPTIKEQVSIGKQYVQQEKEQVFKDILFNPNPFPIYIDTIYFESKNTAFSIISASSQLTIKENAYRPIELRFSPKETGEHYNNLIIKSGGKPYLCKVVGYGISQSYTLLNPVINFNKTKVGNKADTTFSLIVNNGSEDLTIKDITHGGTSDFSTNTMRLPKTLATNDTLMVNAVFIPRLRGRQSSNLQIIFEDNSKINAATLNGTGDAKRSIIVQGKTVHAVSKKGIECQVICTELGSGKICKRIKSNAEGTFNFKTNTDLNYSLTAQLSGFFSSSVNLDLRALQTADTIYANIALSPILSNSHVKLNNIFFASGEATLLDISKPEIDRIIQLMKTQPTLKIEIHGHTDNLGNKTSNMVLSEKRAKSVKEYMVDQSIDQNRIGIKYFGETLPINSNDSPEGRKANRRVEIRFVQ